MFRLRIESHFDAAHKLTGYNGKCAKLHGHTWKVEVFVIGKELNDIEVLVDFKDLKGKLDGVIGRLDHGFLNDLDDIGNPTGENISRYIFENLENLPKNVRLEKVRVWEGSGSYVEYFQGLK